MSTLVNRRLFSYEEIPDIADLIIKQIPYVKYVTFTGSLGAGKTTLIGTILKKLGVNDPICSPTYTYMNTYKYQQLTLYHFDLYRLASLDEFIQAGFDDYLFAEDSFCFIEWPEIIQSVLTDNVCHVALEYDKENTRYITIVS